jgi:hypothetical protein
MNVFIETKKLAELTWMFPPHETEVTDRPEVGLCIAAVLCESLRIVEKELRGHPKKCPVIFDRVRFLQHQSN